MKQIILISFLGLSLLLPQFSMTNPISHNNKNYICSNDTIIPNFSFGYEINIYENVVPPYYNFDGDTTKRNIFYINYKGTDVNIYQIIDYKYDFWSMNDSNQIKILDTIEFYKYPSN
jgi:hypothetical protein